MGVTVGHDWVWSNAEKDYMFGHWTHHVKRQQGKKDGGGGGRPATTYFQDTKDWTNLRGHSSVT